MTPAKTTIEPAKTTIEPTTIEPNVHVRDVRIDRAAAYLLGFFLSVAVTVAGWFLTTLRADVRTCLDSNAACSARLSVLEAILARIEKRLDSPEGPRK